MEKFIVGICQNCREDIYSTEGFVEIPEGTGLMCQDCFLYDGLDE